MVVVQRIIAQRDGLDGGKHWWRKSRDGHLRGGRSCGHKHSGEDRNFHGEMRKQGTAASHPRQSIKFGTWSIKATASDRLLAAGTGRCATGTSPASAHISCTQSRNGSSSALPTGPGPASG